MKGHTRNYMMLVKFLDLKFLCELPLDLRKLQIPTLAELAAPRPRVLLEGGDDVVDIEKAVHCAVPLFQRLGEVDRFGIPVPTGNQIRTY